MKTIKELEKMEYYSRLKYIDGLSTEERTRLYKKTNLELRKRNKYRQELRDYEEEFRKKHNTDTYRLEFIKSELSHTYKRKDWVVLKNDYKIVQIDKTIGVKQYKVNDFGLSKRFYTQDKIHEDDILCDIREFDIDEVIAK